MALKLTLSILWKLAIGKACGMVTKPTTRDVQKAKQIELKRRNRKGK